MSLSREDRVALLHQATRRRQEVARDRAINAIKELTKAGEPVNFRNVARHGGVSVDFLYANRELRSQITRLRNRHHRPAAKVTPDTSSTVVLTLTAQLREARAEIIRLREQLAAAHGENLALRRATATATDYRPAK